MKTIKAITTKVKIGHLEFEGLMAPDGTFGIAIPQMVSLELVPPRRSLKQLQSLWGIEISCHQWKTDLNSKAVNVISLEDFQNLLRILDKAGKPAATDFVDALFGLSLHQLFCDAFNIKFEGAERQEWLKQRIQGKEARLSFTDAIKLWLDNPANNASDNYRIHLYANCSDAINLAVFNRRASKLAVDWNVDKKILRNSMTDKELFIIRMIEHQAMQYILRSGFTKNPLEAVQESIEHILFDKVLR